MRQDDVAVAGVKRGKVWLIGAGPGNPDLITVRGRELLAQADVVLHDALSHPALLEYCAADADIRDVGKLGGRSNPSQTWITAQLVELARAGKRVVRLKGGDPLTFARGAEELEDLARAGIAFEVVPGLSSPVGVSAYAGIPLTHRDISSSVTFITGTDRAGVEWSDEAWKKLATATSTICVLMGMRRIQQISQAIVAGGRAASTPAAVVHWGARPEQRVVTGTLDTIADLAAEAQLTNPAVIIIGEVVSCREQLSWYDRQPLFGKRILVPRPAHQAAETAAAIRDRGADPVLFPVIEIVDPPDFAPLDRGIRELADYQWCLFTSANGVTKFFERLHAAGLDTRALGPCRIGVIGPKTASALASYGIHADLVAKEFVGEGLAEALAQTGDLDRIMIPRALVAREDLPRILREGGARVEVLPAYQTVPASGERAQALSALIEAGRLDVAIFTSSSTVTSTVELLGSRAKELLGRVTVASIGPVTSRTLGDAGIAVDVTAEHYTVAGLLDALEAHFAKA